jgi:CubicO group peptidase (beta-lactamase class C family)
VENPGGVLGKALDRQTQRDPERRQDQRPLQPWERWRRPSPASSAPHDEHLLVGAVGEARAIARLYGCLARGGQIDATRLLSEDTVAEGTRELARGRDPISDAPSAHGIGFARQTDPLPFGPAHDAFGHTGAGGSVHGAWPAQRVGFSYAPNPRRDDDPDQRSVALLNALFHAINSQQSGDQCRTRSGSRFGCCAPSSR